MKTTVVIPVGAGRMENLDACLMSLEGQAERIVLVVDGEEAWDQYGKAGPFSGRYEGQDVRAVRVHKHRPGMEQPRNSGVRMACAFWPEITHVWFVDSDLIVAADAYDEFTSEQDERDEDRILIGSYDWLPPGLRTPDWSLKNDPRWPMFDERGGTGNMYRADLGVALGCFSGNLIWPVKEFTTVGGFWNEIHHGRCEDGELGLRASALGVPMTLVGTARAQHLDHERNYEWIMGANARDVPMLNARHPWVEGKGLIVVAEDGARFDAKCECGQQFNTLEWWTHASTCPAAAGDASL